MIASQHANIEITEAAVLAALEEEKSETHIMKLLFGKRDNISIAERVLVTAASNKNHVFSVIAN